MSRKKAKDAHEQPTRADAIIGWFKNNRLFSVLFAAGVITTGAVKFYDDISPLFRRTEDHSFEERLQCFRELEEVGRARLHATSNYWQALSDRTKDSTARDLYYKSTNEWNKSFGTIEAKVKFLFGETDQKSVALLHREFGLFEDQVIKPLERGDPPALTLLNAFIAENRPPKNANTSPNSVRRFINDYIEDELNVTGDRMEKSLGHPSTPQSK